MGSACLPAQTPCGDLRLPPSRTNMSFFAIIELVILCVVGILCFVDLYECIDYSRDHDNDWGLIEYLKVADYVVIVVGLVFILIGLFCTFSQSRIRTGILCFCFGAILACVIVVLVIKDDRDEDNFLFNICYMAFLVLLAWILWIQSNNA